MLLNFLSAPVYNQWHSLHVQPYISCAVGVAPQNAFIPTSCRRCGSLHVHDIYVLSVHIYACNSNKRNVVRWFSYICHNRNLGILFIGYVCTYWLLVYILHFTLYFYSNGWAFFSMIIYTDRFIYHRKLQNDVSYKLPCMFIDSLLPCPTRPIGLENIRISLGFIIIIIIIIIMNNMPQ